MYSLVLVVSVGTQFFDTGLTGWEVFWLAACALAGSEGGISLAAQRICTLPEAPDIRFFFRLFCDQADAIKSKIEEAVLPDLLYAC